MYTHGAVFIYISEFNHNVSDFSKEQNKDRKSDFSSKKRFWGTFCGLKNYQFERVCSKTITQFFYFNTSKSVATNTIKDTSAPKNCPPDVTALLCLRCFTGTRVCVACMMLSHDSSTAFLAPLQECGPQRR